MAARATIWRLSLATAAMLAVGCVGEVPAPSPDEPPGASDFELVVLEAERAEIATPAGDGDAAEPSTDTEPPTDEGPVVDACACETPACREAWVAENFGCDVCVVLTCEDGYSGHACHACASDDPA